VLYRIKLTGEPELPGETRRRADAALLRCERIAYDVIKSNGGLDTQQGWNIMRAVQALDPHKGGAVTMYGRTLFLTPSRS